MTSKTGSSRFLDKQTRELASMYFEALEGPTALGLYLCLKYSDDESACTHEIDPTQYVDGDVFAADYLAACLLSKYKEGPAGHENHRRSVALSKFWSCEDRLATSKLGFQASICGSTAVGDVLRLSREKISKILGPLKDVFNVDFCGFGPGSSSSISRRKAHPSNKFLSTDVSAACMPYVAWFFQDAGFPRPLFSQVEHSRIEFVPKSFKTDRVIAVEPDWNIFFQKGVGKAIRTRLRLHGLKLDTGAVRHQELSCLASITGSLSTIDLSSASDSISTTLVRFLLPDDWFAFMTSIRTDRIMIEDAVYPLRKFSSMGNGFTFELESLIFYAISLSCRDKSGTAGVVSVFGDDIIIPTGAVDLLQETLAICGFVFNKTKSFSSGYFRESCGAHFFNGRDVKPYFLKDSITHDSKRYHFCNSLRRLSHRLHSRDVLDSRLLLPYRRCRDSIRRVFYIPDGYGDGGLVSYFDEARPATARRGGERTPAVRKLGHGIEGYRVSCLLPVAVSSQVDHEGMYLHKLRSLAQRRSCMWHDQTLLWLGMVSDIRTRDDSPESTGNEVQYSTADTSYRVGRMMVQRWVDPGQIY